MQGDNGCNGDGRTMSPLRVTLFGLMQNGFVFFSNRNKVLVNTHALSTSTFGNLPFPRDPAGDTLTFFETCSLKNTVARHKTPQQKLQQRA